jgi:hypothetical protein
MHVSGQLDIADPRVELKPLHDLEVHVIDPVPARHPFPACFVPRSHPAPGKANRPFSCG